jgi:hypothetical protein
MELGTLGCLKIRIEDFDASDVAKNKAKEIAMSLSGMDIKEASDALELAELRIMAFAQRVIFTSVADP